jgi:serine/threonine-protein kinase
MVSAAGTLLYMPPEGFHHYETPASDVYSAGIIFYQMLTGKFPFPAVDYTTEQEFRLGLAKTRTLVPTPPSQISVGIDKRYDDVCLNALQPDVRKRFQSASDFLSALETLDKDSIASQKTLDSDNRTRAASKKAQKAMEMGGQYAELSAAIQLLEEALQEAPSLTRQYGEVLAQWKSGVVL